MGQKTYDAQTAKFLATVGEAMPSLTATEMQYWIENPKKLATVLCDALQGSTKASHSIDLDAYPKQFNGWRVEWHCKGGQFEWDPSKVSLYLDPAQAGTKRINGNKLGIFLADKSPFNANLLDYLYVSQELIPESWRFDSRGHANYIYFWGTRYRDSGGNLFVRCMFWNGRRWALHHDWLDFMWDSQRPAAVSASYLSVL